MKLFSSPSFWHRDITSERKFWNGRRHWHVLVVVFLNVVDIRRGRGWPIVDLNLWTFFLRIDLRSIPRSPQIGLRWNLRWLDVSRRLDVLSSSPIFYPLKNTSVEIIQFFRLLRTAGTTFFWKHLRVHFCAKDVSNSAPSTCAVVVQPCYIGMQVWEVLMIQHPIQSKFDIVWMRSVCRAS